MSLISYCGTHHTDQNKIALYKQRFDEVLPFHTAANNVQLAPVRAGTQAWHITVDGNEAYSPRFHRTFGFYCGFAAVTLDADWFHITPLGEALYHQRYLFVGNYQNDIAVVCNHKGEYFHIDVSGTPLYRQKWNYCGDFREGSAVVQSNNGLSTHIKPEGSFIHQRWFTDLDVFHKGYARAKDHHGWHHIDHSGRAIYSARYANIEAFYNGCARVETFDGALLVIDEGGNTLRQLRNPTADLFAALSADMVGYWRTFTISTAVELNVFDRLPASTETLSIVINAPLEKLKRLLAALAELQLLRHEDQLWSVTNKGEFLCRNHEKSLASAAIEYAGDLLQRWNTLPEVIKDIPVDDDIFRVVEKDIQRLKGFHTMLRSYARHDYEVLLPLLNIQPSDLVFDAGGGDGTLVEMLESTYPDASIVLGDLPGVISTAEVQQAVGFDLLAPWPIQADKILLTRVLHDWADDQALAIFHQAAQSLNAGGELYVLEMLLIEDDFSGSLCDLHLLAVTGGQERTLNQFILLAEKAGLVFLQVNKAESLVSVLSFSKRALEE